MKKKKYIVIFSILFILAVFIGLFLTYEESKKTEEVLTKHEWIAEVPDSSESNSSKMLIHYIFSNNYLEIIPDYADSEADKQTNEFINGLVDASKQKLKVDYSKFKRSFSYKLDDKKLTFDVEGKNDNIKIKNTDTSQSIKLVSLKQYNENIYRDNYNIVFDNTKEVISKFNKLIVIDDNTEATEFYNNNLSSLLNETYEIINNDNKNKFSSIKELEQRKTFAVDLDSVLTSLEQTSTDYLNLTGYQDDVSEDEYKNSLENLNVTYEKLIDNHYSSKDIFNLKNKASR